MNRALFRHTWRSQRVKLAIVSSALLVWGFLLPIVYSRFGSQFKVLLESGLMPEEFARFGGGDVFSLSGSIALSLVHPIAMVLTSVFSIGFSTSAIAGERQRGTLEVVLARPLSRHTLYLTLLAAVFTFVGMTLAALLIGGVAGAMFAGVIGELAIGNVPLLWLAAMLLFGAFAAIGLAASVSFERFAPALGVTLGIVVVMYFFDVLGSLWPDAAFLRPYSLFHYLKAKEVLDGSPELFDFALLAGVLALAVTWALAVFPLRDLPAPS